MALDTVNCLWVSGQLSEIGKICALSMLRAGYRVRIYTYDRQPEKFTSEIEYLDAEEILPRDQLLIYRRTRSPALGANVFRYRLMTRNVGLWLDLDVLVLRKIEHAHGPVYGYERQDTINNAVLYLEPGSPVLADLLAFTANRFPVPPFISARRRARLRIRKFLLHPLSVEDMRWGVFGPGALTHFITKNRMQHLARPVSSFYPVAFPDYLRPFQEDELPEIGETSDTLHLWNEEIRKTKTGPTRRQFDHSYFSRYSRTELGYRPEMERIFN